MAGTPDKSGEHKASGGPAPEDPRLAVSRAPSGVDQDAGASGEVPGTGSEAPEAAPESAGDERLRAAVAAWVAGDGGSADPSAVAKPGGEEPGAGDPPGDASRAADLPQRKPTGAGAAEAKPSGEADGEGGGKPAAEPGTKADADADAGSADEADTPSAEDAGKADAESGAKADGTPAAELAAEAEADADSDGKGTGKADAENTGKADGKDSAEADAKPAAELAGKADAEADGKSAAKVGATSDGEVDPKSGSKPDEQADAQSGSGSDDKVGGKGDEKADATSDGKVDAKSGSNADEQADPKSGSEPDEKADAKSGSKPDEKTGAKGDEQADAQSGSKADENVGGKADAKSDGKADEETGAKGGEAPDAKAGSKADENVGVKGDEKPDAQSGSKVDAKPGEKADAASGEKADAGPGGKGAAKADGPVDQATAVFKAVPQPVDQPTTTLKAAGTAQSSKFVPLKSLDEGKPTGKELPPEAEQPTVEPAERTTQQPLPPKPPLDLLAELTNTPPPPETRVRTAVRRVKVWTPIVILLIVVFGVIQAVRPLPTPSLALTADSTYSFDGDKASLPWPDEGQGWMDVQGIGTMDNFGKQTPVPIGSVAKSMTAYIVLKDHPLKAGADGPSIDIDATAEKEGGYDADGQNESTLNTVKEGDKISQKDALAAVMIPSANNIARLLARWDAGSEEAFVKKMNATAKKLGMKNTTYTDPSGLKESTVSTAEDQVKLGNELVQIPALTDITKLPTWTDPSGKKWTNYNRLVPYDGAIGIKTGTTTKAGGNLLFAATKDAGGSTVTVVGAILGQHRAPIIDTVNAVSKTAMLAAQDAVTSSTVLKKGDVVGYVDDQLGGHTPVTVTKDVKAVGWAGKTVHLQLADQDGKSVPHTGKAGETVGVLEVGDGEGGAVEVPVALQKGLTEPGFGAKLTRVG
ncbi:D-alanyl-D-alanine carboxypeptidase [Streptomyces sp. NPDC001661]